MGRSWERGIGMQELADDFCAEGQRGKIFDVRRFSTHDGDGIRTTVFFKGCPLTCAWCHNPEGISTERRAMYFPKKCIHCGCCVQAAKHGGVQWGKDGAILLNFRQQEDWDAIMQTCPTGAIAWDARCVRADELVEELLHDEPFFRHGGGVTLSGGEPLLQPEFARGVLELLQAHGVHTAIETALLVPEKNLAMVLPRLDLIFADCKLADEAAHIRATGVSNRRIKENLRYLLTSDKRDRVVVRTPMIPEFTALEENIADIAAFLAGIYPEVHYELLNYNPLASAKYHLVGREYCFSKNPERFTQKQMEAFAAIARSAGLQNVRLEE